MTVPVFPLTILFDAPASWINKSIALVENGKILKTFVFESTKGMMAIPPDEVQRKLVKAREKNQK